MGADFEITVVILPVAHPELNPIEKIWAVTKNIVASRNGVLDHQEEDGFTMAALKGHVEFAMGAMTASMWESFETACIAVEDKYIELADVEEAIHDEEDEEGDDFDGV